MSSVAINRTNCRYSGEIQVVRWKGHRVITSVERQYTMFDILPVNNLDEASEETAD